VVVAKYREIADDLRARIQSGQFPVGTKLPGINVLMEQYQVPGLNTIRAAQQLLVDEGMLETRQGVGAFVIAAESAHSLDIAAELTRARDTLTTVLTALDAKAKHTITFDLLADDDTYYVLTEALREFAARQRFQAKDDPPGAAASRVRRAECAEAALAHIEMAPRRPA
jgi:DNA-binding GntR family transcriptional regulator